MPGPFVVPSARTPEPSPSGRLLAVPGMLKADQWSVSVVVFIGPTFSMSWKMIAYVLRVAGASAGVAPRVQWNSNSGDLLSPPRAPALCLGSSPPSGHAVEVIERTGRAGPLPPPPPGPFPPAGGA